MGDDATPKKAKKEKTPKKDRADRDSDGDSDDEGNPRAVSAIAKPLADSKTTKKILKTVKKGTCRRDR